MSPHRFLLPLIILAGVATVGWFLWPRGAHTSAQRSAAEKRAPAQPAPARPAEPSLEKNGSRLADAGASEPDSGRADVADLLNAPNGTIGTDLRVMHDVFGAWLTTFRGVGNPVGDNREITAALRGENPLRFEFVPANHRALNNADELCDRWGTPFRFHALSGTRMEIRSAGPDRTFGTRDDAEWAPWPRSF